MLPRVKERSPFPVDMFQTAGVADHGPWESQGPWQGSQPPERDRYASGPNSMSTGVGVVTSVLNLSVPLDRWMRKTAMLSVSWLAA